MDDGKTSAVDDVIADASNLTATQHREHWRWFGLAASLVIVALLGGLLLAQWADDAETTGHQPPPSMTVANVVATATLAPVAAASSPREAATPPPTAGADAVRTAEEALAFARATLGLDRAGGPPGRVTSVGLTTLGDLRASDRWARRYHDRTEGPAAMPVWVVEVDDTWIGHHCLQGVPPEGCHWDHLVVAVNAVTGELLGLLFPDAYVDGLPTGISAPLLPPGATLATIDDALRLAHEQAQARNLQPARVIAIDLVMGSEAWPVEPIVDPGAVVWQIELAVGDEDAVSGRWTLLFDAATGEPAGAAAAGPAPAVVLEPWPTPRPATPNPSTLDVPAGAEVATDAEAAALAQRFARESMGAGQAQIMLAHLTTPRQALYVMQGRGVAVTVTWDDDAQDDVVWWFELAGDEFASPGCPACPLAPKAYIGIDPADGEALWAVTEIPPLPPTPVPATLHADAALANAEAASAAALDFAVPILEAHDARAVSAELMTVREALTSQQLAAGTRMMVWDRRTLDVPVWFVRLEGESFHLYDCPDCPTGTAALITLRARDEGVYWVAVGTPGSQGQPELLTQVIPWVAENPRYATGHNAITPEEMAATAIERASRWEQIELTAPEVLLAIPASFAMLHRVGIWSGDFSPTCQRPLYLVILRGEVDGKDHYLGYVFDLAHGAPGGAMVTISGPTDEPFRHALDGTAAPTPPQSDSPEPYAESGDLGCEDVWV